MVGTANGTLLSYEPAPPPWAPEGLNLGDVVEFNAAGPYTVKSQDADHPFYLAA